MDPVLVINKNSWHFNYFCRIRRLWGIGIPDQTSLCPYVQTTFWLTFLSILTAPLWLFGLITRLFIPKKVLAYLTRNYYSLPEKDAYIIRNIVLGAVSLLICCAVGLITLFLVYGLVPTLGFIWWVILNIGWLIFLAIGKVGKFFVWLLSGYWSAILYVLSIVAVSCAIVWSLVKLLGFIVSSKPFQYLISKMDRWFDKRQSVRIVKTEKYLQSQTRIRPEIYEPTFFDRISLKFRFFFRKKPSFLFMGRSAKVLSGFGILWTYLVAIKKKACPVVQFVDVEK